MASETGFEIDEDGSSVIDHMNYDIKDNGEHTLIVTDHSNLIDAKTIVGNKNLFKPILFKGTGIISDQNNPLLLDILTASSSAYSYDPKKKITQVYLECHL